MKAFLRWPGNKSILSEAIEEIYEGERWIDPFCGSLGLPLNLCVDTAICADINPHLINLFQSIKNGEFNMPRWHQASDRDSYLRNRDRFNDLISSGQNEGLEMARLFYYFNQTGYNGLSRYNQSGLFNVPHGGDRKTSFITDWSEYSDLFRYWDFRCCNYQQIASLIEPTDFIYLDPPYVGSGDCYHSNFDWWDQATLADWASRLSCKVVVSNAWDDDLAAMYESVGFEVDKIHLPRWISCDGNRDPAAEILAHKLPFSWQCPSPVSPVQAEIGA